MARPISELLSDMSVHAKHAEDEIAEARRESHDSVVARREKIRASATAAIDDVDRDVRSVQNSIAGHWDAFRTKIATDIDTVKTKHAQREHERDVMRAQRVADSLEREAELAVGYAIASIEQAEFSVLDSIAARIEADELAHA